MDMRPQPIKDEFAHPILSQSSVEFLKYIVGFVLIGASVYLITLHLYAPQQTVRAYAVGALLPVGAAGWYFLSRNNIQAVVWILAFGIWAQITTAAFFLGGVSSTATIFYPLIIFAMGWLVSTRAATAIALLTAAAMLSLALMQARGMLPAPLPTHPALRWVLQFTAFALSVVLIAQVARSYRSRLEDVRRLGRDLAARNAELLVHEEELLSARNQLAATLDAVPDLLFEMDLEGRYLSCHSPRVDLLAVPPAEFIGKKVAEILPPAAAAVCLSALREAHETGYSHGKQFELQLAQGRLWFELAISRKPVDPGQQPRFIVLSRDITERTRAQAELRTSELQLACILGATADGMLAVDGSGKVIRANQRFAQLWRIPQALLDRKDDQALLDFVLAQVSDPEEFLTKVRALYDSDAEVIDNLHFKDGRVFERYTAPLILNGTNIGRVWSFRDVSEREQAKSALIETNHLLQTVIDAAPVRVFWKDRTSRYLGCNPAFANDAGRRCVEDIVGKNDFQLAWAAQAALYRADDQAVMTSGIPKLAYEEQQTTPDGRNIWLRTSKVPLKDGRNETIGVLGVYEDITAEKITEQRLKMAIDVTRVLLWEIDFKTDRLIYDQSMLSTLSLDTAHPPESLSRWIELVHPDDRGRFQEHVLQALAPGDPAFDLEYRMVGVDGQIQWIHSSGRVAKRDEQQQPEIAVGTSMNISARKRAEEAIRSSEARSRNMASMLRLMCDNVPDMIWAKDLNKRYIFANKAICEQLLHAADTEEPVGKNDLFFAQRERASHPDDPQWHTFGEQCQDSDAITLERGTYCSFEEYGNVRGKHLILDVHKAPLYDEVGKIIGVVGSARDVTAHRRMQEMQLQSQKMESLGTLAGGIAHDFNNALATILGNLELVRQDVGASHEAWVSLDEISKASRRAKSLVQQILTFGRKNKTDRKVMSLSLPLLEAARLLRAALPARTSLEVDCKADAPPVLADATQIEQVLINLCTNAYQAVQDLDRPGMVEIELKGVTLTETDGELPPGRYACLSVKDNGAGMDEQTRGRIFEPFFTTKPKGKGTGLGLSVVHGILQEHHARIEVISAPRKGSEFRMFFAEAQVPVVDGNAVSPHAGRTPASGKHVMYVDDEAALVFLMTRLLERKGYRVSGYTDPLEAIAVARANPAQFDLVVTDYNMPDMSGLEVARAFKEMRHELPVILASGYITEELRAAAPAAGIRELVYKPNTVEDLCEAVDRFVNLQNG